MKYILALGHSLLLTQSLRAYATSWDGRKPGHWMQIENSKLRDAAPCDGIGCNQTPGPNCQPENGDPSLDRYNLFALKNISHVVNGWSGAAFDTKRQSLLVFGGGHKG